MHDIKIDIVMNWLIKNQYMSGSRVNDYETTIDLLKQLEAAQAKDSTATGPQHPQAVICSKTPCMYCEHDSCDSMCVTCFNYVRFSGRKLTAC